MAWDKGNFLSALLGQANSMEPSFMREPAPRPMGGMPMGGTQPGSMGGPSLADIERQAGVPAPRKRASVVDILGGLFDTAAELGGVNPQYQPTLDARLQREREAELYPLEVQKVQLGNRDVRGQIQERQAKLMAPLAQRAKQYLEQGGDINKILPVMYQTLGLTPDEVQQYDPQIRANPMETLSMLAVSGEKAGDEYGLTPFYVKGPDGNLIPYQTRKSGGASPIPLRPGEIPAPGVIQLDLGTSKEILDNRGGGRIGEPRAVAGNPAVGDVPLYNADGTPTGQYTQPVGSQANRERVDKIREDLNKLESLEASITAGEGALGNVQAGIDLRAGSGAMTTPDMGVGGRLVATAQDLLPITERVFNEDATTGRNMIQSAALRVILDLDSSLTQARGAGVEMGSKQMDTPKELQVRLETIANSNDYKSAMSSFNYIKGQAEAIKQAVRAKIIKKRAELEKEMGGGTRPSTAPTSAAPSGGMPTVQSDDDFDALPSGTQFLDPNGKIREKP